MTNNTTEIAIIRWQEIEEMEDTKMININNLFKDRLIIIKMNYDFILIN